MFVCRCVTLLLLLRMNMNMLISWNKASHGSLRFIFTCTAFVINNPSLNEHCAVCVLSLYPVSCSSLGENTLLILVIRGEWPNIFGLDRNSNNHLLHLMNAERSL